MMPLRKNFTVDDNCKIPLLPLLRWLAAILEISYLDIEIIPDLLKHIMIHAEYHLAAIKCNKMQPKAFLGFIIGF